MRKRILGSLAVIAAGTGLSFGQGPPPGAYPPPGPGMGGMMAPGGPPGPDSGLMLRNGQPIIPPPYVGGNLSQAEFGPPSPGPDMGDMGMGGPGGGGGGGGRGAWEDGQVPGYWFGFDYLMWWAKDQSAFPLVTTGAAGNGGVIGTPGTTVLLGRDPIEYGTSNGFRTWFGGYLDEERQVGFEVSGFMTERVGYSDFFQSSAVGTPVLAVPFVNVVNGQAQAYVVSSPGTQTGNIRFSTSTQAYGVEGNTLMNLYRGDQASGNGIDFLCGPRFFSLEERLELTTSTSRNAGNAFPFAGQTIATGGTVQTLDRIRTFNEFYGLNLGFRGDHHYGRLSVNWTAKVAAGYMNAWADHSGASSLNTAGTLSSVPGGRFVEPADIGRSRDDYFAIVPEGALNLGYQLNSKVRLQVGYTYLFVNQVLRPGTILDNRVNAPALPTDAAFGTGPARSFGHDLNKKSQFNLQGVNFGIQVGF